jgi:hypothetical protein
MIINLYHRHCDYRPAFIMMVTVTVTDGTVTVTDGTVTVTDGTVPRAWHCDCSGSSYSTEYCCTQAPGSHESASVAATVAGIRVLA